MRRCAFLTLEHRRGYVIDDELAFEPLATLGWRVDMVPWRQTGVAWDIYDAIVIRSTWDYTEAPDAFLQMLRGVTDTGVRLFNSFELVKWNLRKTYLGDLAMRGVSVVPTVWRQQLHPGELHALFDELHTPEIVIKPVVGLNADGAFRIDARAALSSRAEALPHIGAQPGSVERFYAHREFIAQPFVASVVIEGEFSLFYFNGEHSHTVLKTPKAGDFRVQEEHGGVIRAVEADAALRAAGKASLAALGEVPLYARADFVRAPAEETFWLMELELIEPSLYLRMDPEAPRRFARALHDRVTMANG